MAAYDAGPATAAVPDQGRPGTRRDALLDDLRRRSASTTWSSTARQPLDELRERLAGRVSVLVGHSGVGKSTLVNALVPGADRAIGVVNAVTGRGRHTSTSAIALELPGRRAGSSTPRASAPSGWPTSTSTGSSTPSPTSTTGTGDCPRGCTHDEPECALDAWVAAGHSDPARLESLRRLLRSRTAPEED